MNMKKLSISMFIVFVTVFGLFINVNKAAAQYQVQTCNSATLNGYVSPNGTPTSAWFEWGPTPSLGYSTTPQTYTAYSDFSAVINGLTQNTTYYYETEFNNAPQGSWSGSMVSFTTASCQPTVVTPTVNLTANPTSVAYNGTSILTWNSTNATSCIASGGTNGWGGNQNTSGSFNTGALANTTSYNLTCTSSTGAQASAYATVTVAAQQIQNPTVSLYANPTSIQSGANSTLTWSSNNATSCQAYWTSSTATSGSGVVVPSGTTTYSITCYGTNGTQVSASATVSVTQQIKTPTVSLTANPTSVAYNGTSTLIWNSTNATSCIASGGTNGWGGNQNTSGSFNTGALANTTSYNLTCTSSTGAQASAYATVSVSGQVQPTVSLSANPTSVAYNGTSILTWNSTNATSCIASGGTNGWGGNQNTSGSFNTGALANTTSYNLTCTSSTGAQASAYATVTVAAQQIQNPTVSLYANPTSIQSGANSTLTWSSNNATSCQAYWTSSTATSGSGVVVPSGTTTYSITCYGTNGTQVSASATVSVNQIQYQNPTVSLYANPTSIQSGANSTLTWSSNNATSCQAYWTSSTATSGSGVVVPSGTTTYSITCYGTNGTQVSASATVSVNQIQYQNPTVSLYANPTSIQSGANSTLTWSSNNATSCQAYWTSSTATSGSGVVVPSGTTTYSITCYGTNGTQVSASATVSVNQIQYQNPTVSLYANPTSIQSGANSTLTWSSNNATSCQAYWTSSTATSGSGVVVPSGTTTYSITCYGTNGTQVSASATVSVNQIQNQIPTVNIYANPSSVNYNGSSIISWNSTNASYCSITGGYNGLSGTQSTSGSITTGALTYTTTYNIVCTSSTGQQATGSTTVYVNQNQILQPTVNIYANPSSVNYNGSSIISWNSTNASYCSITGGYNGLSGTQSTSGSITTGALTYTTTYNIVCTSSTGQQATGSTTVYVNQNYQPIVPVYPVPTPIYPQPIASNLSVVTTQATQVLSTSAQLNSLISSSDSSPINAWFEWGPTINLGNTTTTTAVGTLPSVIHTDTLSGLSPGTTYYFRAIAQDSYQSSNGYILSFTTTGAQSPTTVIRYVNRTAASSLLLITSSVNRDQPIVPTIDNTRPHPGDEINYTINYQNVGTGSATNLSLQLVLPQEVTYLSSNPINPNVLGNTLVFNLGTLRGGASGVVTVKTQVNSDATAGTLLNFPATLNYVDPSGNSQSVNANVSAQVWSATTGTTSPLGAFAFGAGFFPTNIFGWLIIIILILILILLAKYIYGQRKINPAYLPPPTAPFIKRTTTVVDHQPLGKKTTTTTVQE